MATWQLRRPPPRIEIEPNLLKELDPRVAALLSRADLQIKLFLIATNNTAPVVLCTIHRRDRPATAVGASARLRLSDAITKATIEAYHTWAWALTLERKAPVACDDIVEFEHHVRHYFEPDSQKALSFLDEGEGVRFRDIPDSGPASIDELVQALNASGHDVFAIDLTSPDVVELGFVVFRTMVSGMQPLACGVRNYPLDDRRLRRVASDWAFPFPHALNSDPHPFP
jgi:ribosomal protein S12 methylthiotransferase accessory factor